MNLFGCFFKCGVAVVRHVSLQNGGLAVVAGALFLATGALSGMSWPTPHPGPRENWAEDRFVQPTVSGETESGLFGCVRNNGARFHEGLDIAPYQKRDRRREATDPVVSAFPGSVVHISRVAGHSSYGRYVVLEHAQFSPTVYTLYAHLAKVADGLEEGDTIEAGANLGIMGRSAGGYSIPRERAHLHFEIAVRLTDQFQPWYDRQRFGSKNEHGLFNGMNLLGLDPLDCYRWLQERPTASFSDYYASLAPGVIVEVVTARIPDFVRRSPGLVTGGKIPSEVAGWRLTFSGWGMPLHWEPLDEVPEGAAAGDATVVAVDPAILETYGCRQIVKMRDGNASLGNGGRQLLELLFNFY